jgi:hypothetical protein
MRLAFGIERKPYQQSLKIQIQAANMIGDMSTPEQQFMEKADAA